jgi:RimJ/RimL family protein N-acetyltransferase
MLIGERVRLRALEREDAAACWRWMNDPEVREHLLVIAPMSRMAEDRWIEGLADRESDHVFAVEALVPGIHAVRAAERLPLSPDGLADGDWRHIGNVGLHDVDLVHRVAKAGIALGEKDCWGQGFGREALVLLLRFAFHELGMNRVELEVFEGNLRAQKTYRAVGFVQEGVRREGAYKHGRFVDCITMGILRGEFDVLHGG